MLPSATIRPSRIIRIRSISGGRSAMWCVISRIPVPCRASLRSNPRNSAWAARSSAFEGSSSSSICLLPSSAAAAPDPTSARPIITRLCCPADISPTGFSASVTASTSSNTSSARARIASVTVKFGQSVLLEKNPVNTASRPVVCSVAFPGSSAETTPNRFFNSVKSHRPRPKMLTFISGCTSG